MNLTPAMLLAGLLMPLVTAQAPLRFFGGALALAGTLALGRFFMALAGLDPASTFGGMGSRREMTIAAVAEPAMMLAIFTVAITTGDQIVTRFDPFPAIRPRPDPVRPARRFVFSPLSPVLMPPNGCGCAIVFIKC